MMRKYGQIESRVKVPQNANYDRKFVKIMNRMMISTNIGKI